ncbi:hypothetical protein PG987_011380 [Apiospora arundinis]
MHSNQCFLPVHHCEEGLSRYGHLYDIEVQVFPTSESVIVDVLNEPTSRVLGPGSSLLTLVQVCINASQSPRTSGEAHKDDPDNLMADLEHHLGNVQTEYIDRRRRRRVALPHAARDPSQRRHHPEQPHVGLVAAAHALLAPVPTLFAIIAAHWGPIRANDIMHRIIASRSTPRKVAMTTATTPANTTTPVVTPRGFHHRRAGTDAQGSEETVRAAASTVPERTATAPPLQVPRRQTSLLRKEAASPESTRDGGEALGKARKIWTAMRRTSSGSQPSYFVSSIKRVPGPLKADSLLPRSLSEESRAVAAAVAEGKLSRQELLRDMAMHDIAESPMALRSIVPTPEEYYLGQRRMQQSHNENLEAVSDMERNGG